MITTVSSFIFLLTAAVQGSGDQLEIRLKSDKESVVLGESMRLTVAVKNISGKDIEIQRPVFDENSISFELTQEEDLKRTFVYSRYNGDPLVRERIAGSKIKIDGGAIVHEFVEFLPPLAGKFRLKARLMQGKEFIFSNSMSLEVKSKKSENGDEQKVLGAVLTLKFTKDGNEVEESFLVRFFGEDSFNSVSNFALLINTGFYDGLKIFRAVKYGFLQTGCPYNKGFGTPGYLYKRENTSKGFDIGSIGLCNAPKGQEYSGSQFFVSLASLPGFKEKFTQIGQIITKKDVLQSSLQNLPVSADSTLYSDVIVKSFKLALLSEKDLNQDSEQKK
ncbi:MAG: peptidylprolyl isomerase [Planctomycetes bacterium]|nr:peptidylprolyl isomerase [Planctomycetota bacterium]